ncbi:hypothetical protein ACFL6W_09985 [Thermodesulfobacteriota bacterium]
MVFNKAIQPLLIVLLQAIVLSAGCGSQSTDISEDEKAKVITRDSTTEPTESEISQGKHIQNTLPVAVKNESQNKHASMDINWGSEVNLDEMIAMAKKGQITEIHWYVMPNILRAQTSHGDIFHLRNENKGVDLRNTLIQAGIKVGKGGILFRHFF